jgi:hypothetical protein
VLIPTDGDSRPAPAASQRPVLAPGRTSHLPGSRLTRHQRGFKQFARPVFPSLWPPGWNGPPLDSCPGLRTPPTKSQRRTPRWGQAIEHGPGTTAQLTFPSISNPVVHSIRATSRRTSPRHSCEGRRAGRECDHSRTIRRPAPRPVWGGREIVKVAAQFESNGRSRRPSLSQNRPFGSPLNSSPVVAGRVEKDSSRGSRSSCPLDWPRSI